MGNVPFFECHHGNIVYDKKAKKDKCLSCGQMFNEPDTIPSKTNIFCIGSETLPDNWYVLSILFPNGTYQYMRWSTRDGLLSSVTVMLDLPEKQQDPRLQWDNHLLGKDIRKYQATAYRVYGTVYRLDPQTIIDNHGKPSLGVL